MNETQIQRRRAIEALRAGVPNRDAVSVLGSSQTAILDRFGGLLDNVDVLAVSGAAPGGLLVAGGFGSGKSHLLEHLRHVALERSFVVSKVVVSKETPLHDPSKMFRAAIESAVVPDRQGAALTELAAGLEFDDGEYAELFKWAHDPSTGLNPRFAASLFLFENLRQDDLEFVDLIVRFWGGDPIKVTELRRRLREVGEAATYALGSISERNLSLERFRFVSRLIKAAGYAGWVVLIDEVELIGRYSVLQRAKSYAEVARWVRGDVTDRSMPICAVLAVTDDFEAEVLNGKNDAEVVPSRLRSRQTVEYDLLAGQAETGMRIIEQETVKLTSPDEAELDRAYVTCKQLHGEAYGWTPPDVPGLERLPSNRMRQYVRAWINEWDLLRLDPSYRPELEVTHLRSDSAEDAAAPPDGEDAP